MPTTYNLSAIMTAAHRAARKAVAAGTGRYRIVFANALAREWRMPRDRAVLLAFNLGLPVGTCPADRTAPVPVIRPGFAQFGSARVFFGPNAREAAIADVANRVASTFTHARAAGRRAVWSA